MLDYYNLQYFVFDKSGDKILEADSFHCYSKEEFKELKDTIIRNFNEIKETEQIQLLLSCGNNILFNSKIA